MRTALFVVLIAGLALGTTACGGGASADTGKPLTEVRAEAKAADTATLQKLVDNTKIEISEQEGELEKLQSQLKDAMGKAVGGAKADFDALKTDIAKLTDELKALKDRLAVYVQELAAKQK